MFRYFLRKYIKDEDYSDPHVRSSIANLQGNASVLINILIFIMKFAAGIWISSISLIADAFHTLSDILSSLIIMIGFKMASKPPDREHPFGHQRIESITGIIVSVLLIVTGIELIRSSAGRIMAPSISSFNLIVLIIVIITIIMKEWLARFALFLGQKINSPAIIADFWHHRTDAISSLFVIIAIITKRLGLPVIDGYMGIIVSIMIIYSGIKILTENSNELIGKPPEEYLLKQLGSIAQEFKDDGLLGIHDIILNYYGRRIIGSVHLEIDERIDLLDAHTVSEAFEDTVLRKANIHLTAHIDPINTHNPLIRDITGFMKKEIERFQVIESVHDIRLIGSDSWINVACDMTINRQLSASDRDEIREYFRKILSSRFNVIHDVIIKFEPLFSY